MITLNHYLLVSGLLFAIGTAGIIARRNALVILMCLEINLNAASLAAVAFARFQNRPQGQVFFFFIIAVAAAEVAVALAILVALFRQKKSMDLSRLDAP